MDPHGRDACQSQASYDVAPGPTLRRWQPRKPNLAALNRQRVTIMTQPTDLSRDLLFGLLALQNGLINQGALFSAFAAWTQDKSRSLADHLVKLGHLDAPRRAAVEAIANVHVRALGGEIEKSLAVLSVGQPTRDRLVHAGGPDVEATLGHVGVSQGPTRDDVDPERTATFSVGSATSDGQRFRILRPHARGGLGAVFVALDSELDREVALKQILDDRADDPASRVRFLVEAQITGGLEHPGIVPVYGLGAYDDGRPYYAMRFIRGESLKEAISQFHRSSKIVQRRPARRVRASWNSASCSAVSWTCATPSIIPTRAACSTATSSRPTSSWASTARP